MIITLKKLKIAQRIAVLHTISTIFYEIKVKFFCFSNDCDQNNTSWPY